MPWPRFFLYNAIGAALWVGFWGGATYWLGRRFFEYLRSFGWSGRLVLALVALGVVALVAKLWWHWRSHRGATGALPRREQSPQREEIGRSIPRARRCGCGLGARPKSRISKPISTTVPR